MSSKQNALLVANKGRLNLHMHVDSSKHKKAVQFTFLFVGIINLNSKLLYLY